jgi:hypothetical protein
VRIATQQFSKYIPTCDKTPQLAPMDSFVLKMTQLVEPQVRHCFDAPLNITFGDGFPAHPALLMEDSVFFLVHPGKTYADRQVAFLADIRCISIKKLIHII